MALSRHSSIYNHNLKPRFLMVPDNNAVSKRIFFICSALQCVISLSSMVFLYKKHKDVNLKLNELEKLKKEFFQLQEKLESIKELQKKLHKELDHSLQELYQKNEELYQQKSNGVSENNSKKKIFLGNLGLRSKL